MIAKKIIELFEKLERTFQLNSMYKIVENEFAKKLAYECKNLPISAFQKFRQEKKCTIVHSKIHLTSKAVHHHLQMVL